MMNECVSTGWVNYYYDECVYDNNDELLSWWKNVCRINDEVLLWWMSVCMINELLLWWMNVYRMNDKVLSNEWM